MIGVANLLDLFRRISFTEELVRTEGPKAQRVVPASDEQKRMEVRVP